MQQHHTLDVVKFILTVGVVLPPGMPSVMSGSSLFRNSSNHVITSDVTHLVYTQIGCLSAWLSVLHC